ncbi:hypothetical protein JYB64_06140 [Algoriphagus aestuarii]|nr:hypothetical protein [Algoriphagus aestuarii]
MNNNLMKMREDYENLVPGLNLDYEKLKLFMYLRRGKKGVILKESHTVENCSRYICEGYLGLLVQKEEGEVLKEIFRSTDVAFDIKSYSRNKKTKSYLVCLSDVTYFEVSKKSEHELVKTFPEFIELGLAINHRLQDRLVKRSSIRGMGIHKGYKKFLQEFPAIETLLSQNRIASYFNCTTRTVRSVQKKFKTGEL